MIGPDSSVVDTLTSIGASVVQPAISAGELDTTAAGILSHPSPSGRSRPAIGSETSERSPNALGTCASASELPADDNGVVSGVGAWVLLTALLEAASGTAQTELEHAVSVTRNVAAASVEEQLERLQSLESVSAALGLWLHPDVPLRAEYRKAMRRMTVDSLPSDVRDLDRWASDQTQGLIPTFPGVVSGETRLVLASALAMEADWVAPFKPGMGRWRNGDEWLGWLTQTTTDRDRASILHGGAAAVGRVVCPSLGSFEVHLITGSTDYTPGEILGLGIDALCGEVEEVKGSELQLGDGAGCVSVRMMPAAEPRLTISLPAFEIRSDHDLLAHPQLFGLKAATDSSEGHFPGLSSYPLSVERALQTVMAGFSEKGFRAAAVSVIMTRAGASVPPDRALVVHALFDQPFGFLVVDPSSQLVLIAGWVADPSQQPSV